jgi:chromosome segregation ATPase
MDKVKELEANIERYKTIANTLKVDLNMRDARIRDLERELAAARREIRSLEVGTQTMQKLEILGDSDDDDGFDPRATGTFKSPWERAR